jgi:hypothetical protein
MRTIQLHSTADYLAYPVTWDDLVDGARQLHATVIVREVAESDQDSSDTATRSMAGDLLTGLGDVRATDAPAVAVARTPDGMWVACVDAPWLDPRLLERAVHEISSHAEAQGVRYHFVSSQPPGAEEDVQVEEDVLSHELNGPVVFSEENLRLLPEKPGVYIVGTRDRNTLYVGSAKRLGRDVVARFHSLEKRPHMFRRAGVLWFVVSKSEEAARIRAQHLRKTTEPTWEQWPGEVD